MSGQLSESWLANSLEKIQMVTGNFGLTIESDITSNITLVVGLIAGFYMLWKILGALTSVMANPGAGLAMLKHFGRMMVVASLLNFSGLAGIIAEEIVEPIMYGLASSMVNITGDEIKIEKPSELLGVMDNAIMRPVIAIGNSTDAIQYSVTEFRKALDTAINITTSMWVWKALITIQETILFLYILEFHFIKQLFIGFFGIVLVLAAFEETRSSAWTAVKLLVEAAVTLILAAAVIGINVFIMKEAVQTFPVVGKTENGQLVTKIDANAVVAWFDINYWGVVGVMAASIIMLAGIEAMALRMVAGGSGGGADIADGAKRALGTAARVATGGAIG